MFTVTLEDGAEYTVRFRRFPTKKQRKDPKFRKAHPSTVCLIYSSDRRMIGHGSARCNLSVDTFDKEKGRRLSLAVALHRAFPGKLDESPTNRLTRTIFWNEYWEWRWSCYPPPANSFAAEELDRILLTALADHYAVNGSDIEDDHINSIEHALEVLGAYLPEDQNRIVSTTEAVIEAKPQESSDGPKDVLIGSQ